MSDSRPDLSKLVRHPSSPQTSKRQATWLLPLGILLGFALLFLVMFRDRLIPAKRVEVTPALGLAAKSTPTASAKPDPQTPEPDTSGRLLFQASGWIEPDPLPIKATALTDGFVDEVRVLEGATVKQGEILATLVDADARIARDAAEATVKVHESDHAALLAAADSTLHMLAAERAGLEYAQADLTEAEDKFQRNERMASGTIPESERVSAKLEFTRKQASIRIREALIAQAEANQRKTTQDAASMASQTASAKAALAQAILNLERTRIASPINGRVMRLMAAPGQKKMISMDEPDSSTIAVLYDPKKLQVRVDVPLADAAGLAVGQAVRVRCNLLPDRVFGGVVTRIAGEADLQRNTLQAKVRILDPDDQMRPEMLCRAEFLEAPSAGSGTANSPTPPAGTPDGTGPLAVFVPESSISGDAVWVCDPDTSRVSKRPIVRARESRDGHQRLESGVRPGEWVVRNPGGLREGQRVKPIQIP